jgi:SulP family sulfate permease
VTLLSRPVISGFASAAALTIGMSQLPGLLGSSLTGPPNAVAILLQLTEIVGHTHIWSAGIGLGAVGVILLVKRLKPAIPGGLIVVILGILLVWLLRLDLEGVKVVGSIPSGIPSPSLPAISGGMVRELLPIAMTLALVQFTILISLGKLFASRHRYRVDANRELIAVGTMNILGSLFRAVPVSASFSRSAVNEATGSRTPASNFFAALLIGITLLFLTPAFYYLPIPVFSAIIMVAALALVDVAEVRLLLRSKRIDGLIAIVTFLVTLLVGIQEGIVVGILASITAILFRITRPEIVELGHLPGTRLYRELDRRPDARRLAGVYILRFDASFSFVNADYIRDHLVTHVDTHPDTRTVLLDATSINDLDMTAADVLSGIYSTLTTRGVRLVLSGVKGRVKDVLDASGLTAQMGDDCSFLSAHMAVVSILREQGLDESSLQTGGQE